MNQKREKKFPYADDAADAQLSSLPVDEQAGDDDSDDDDAVACAADDEIKISEKDSVFLYFQFIEGKKWNFKKMDSVERMILSSYIEKPFLTS